MLVASGHDSWSGSFSDSSDGDVSIAWEENWNETEKVVEEVQYDDVVSQLWYTVVMAHHAHIIQGTKIPLTEQCEW